MYFGSTKNEWTIMIFLLLVALAGAIYIWKKRNFSAGLFTFSLLSNFIFFIDSGSTFFDVYNLKWIVKFTLYYWPWINVGLFILLVFNYIKNKRENS